MVGEVSEDGLWIWDGEKWLPNGTFTPPAVNDNLSTSPEELTQSIISELKFFESSLFLPIGAKQELTSFERKIQENQGKLYPHAYLDLCEYQYNVELGELFSGDLSHYTALGDMKNITLKKLKLVEDAMRCAIKLDLENWEIVCKMKTIEINTDAASFDDNYHQYHSDEVKMNTYINQLETMQEGVHLWYAYYSLFEFHLSVFDNEDFDQNMKSRIISKMVTTAQKCSGVANRLEDWRYSFRSKTISLIGYLLDVSPGMSDYCYSEANKLMAEKNIPEVEGLYIHLIRLVELAERDDRPGEESQIESRLNYICNSNGVNERIVDISSIGLRELSRQKDSELPPPPTPDIAAGFSSQSSTTSSNRSLLDSIEVTVNGDKVGFSWSSALPGNVKEALRAMNDADQFASVDDLGKYVGISQFDEDTKIKLWSVWRQRLAEFKKIRGNQKQLEINSAASTAITVLFILIGAYFAGATDFYDDYKYLEDVYESNCVGGGVFADIGRDITGVSGDCQELKTFLEDKKWMLLFNPSIFCGLGLICLGIAASGIKYE